MYGKSNMETYITICKMYSQWEFAVWLGKLKPGLCINLEVWNQDVFQVFDGSASSPSSFSSSLTPPRIHLTSA